MTIDHRRLPRKKRPISPRDQAIYFAYRSQGLTQAQLANQFHLGQRRISTIIHRVEQSATSSPNSANSVPGSTLGPQYPEAPASSCLASAPPSTLNLPVEVARACAQQLYTAAIRSFDRSPKEITTTQTGHRGQSPFKVTIRQELPPNVQFIKAALRASDELTRLAFPPRPVKTPAVNPTASNYSICSNPTSAPSPQTPSPQSLPSEIQNQKFSDQPVNFQDALNLLLSYMTPQPPTTS